MFNSRSVNGCLNFEKAEFFDFQADKPWAAQPYTHNELEKINHIFSKLPNLSGFFVLEPGCGTGRMTQILAREVGQQGLVWALDISQQMVAQAKNKTLSFQNVQIFHAALETITLEENALDLIFCHQVFPHFDHKQKALKTMVRALKPHGYLVIFHLISYDQINDLHRKAGTAVAKDMMPAREKMQEMIEDFNLQLKEFDDPEDKYLIVAQKTTPC